MTLKAYITYPGDSPLDCGCLLGLAASWGKAKQFAYHTFDWAEQYTDMSANRRPDYDRFAVGDKTYAIETNNELPDGAPKFYSEDI